MSVTTSSLSRRQFAGRLVAGAVALSSAVSLAEDRKLDYVDAHSHIWTRDVKTYPLAKGITVEDLAPPSFTTEELLKIARPHGVARVVLIAHSKFYQWDNSYMTDTAAKWPDTFRVVGMVDDRGEAPGRTMRTLLKQHVTGFRITSWIHGKDKWLSGPGMQEMWKTAADTRQAICCLANTDELPAVDAMCGKYPETPVVIDHLGRIGLDGEIREQDVRNLCQLAKRKHVHVKVSAFYALGRKRPPHAELVPLVRRVYDAFGAERLMWGSDCPYQLDGTNTYTSSLKFVREGLDFFSPTERDWLLKKTANKVFFGEHDA